MSSSERNERMIPYLTSVCHLKGKISTFDSSIWLIVHQKFKHCNSLKTLNLEIKTKIGVEITLNLTLRE